MTIATEAPLVKIGARAVTLEGVLDVPGDASGIVVFSHGSGSGRHSPRNQYVAAQLRAAGLGTLLLDLLTPSEERDYELRFDIPLLTERLGYALDYIGTDATSKRLPAGLFGASTGAASALRLAASMPQAVRAVVSRGGRPDLAGKGVLGAVKAPTLLIVGGDDRGVAELNRVALGELKRCAADLVLVPGATHLFEEPGTLERAAMLARDWFVRYLVDR